MATLIFTSGRGLAILSAQEEGSGNIYNLMKRQHIKGHLKFTADGILNSVAYSKNSK